MTNNCKNPNAKALELLEAAHAVVDTFSVENTTGNIALADPAIVKMLKGVDCLLAEAQSEVMAVAKLHANGNSCGLEWDVSDTLPESWMFKPVNAASVNVDMLCTACCRAQGLVRVFIALGSSEGGFDCLHEHDFLHSFWGLEGILAQAISILEIAKPIIPDDNNDETAEKAAA